jgi:hypothetical protein
MTDTTQTEDLGYDAECDYCDARASDEEEGSLSKKAADDWGYWHKRDCEPQIKLLSPTDLAQEREHRQRLKEKFPEAFRGGAR